MATIGTITVAFGADLRGLSEGIEESIDLFDDISERIEELSEELDTLSSRIVVLRTSVDTSAISAARRDVDGLSEAASAASPQIVVQADAQQLRSARGDIEGLTSALSAASDAARATNLGSAVDGNQLSDAAGGAEALSESVDEVTVAASSGRGSLASLLVTAARVTSVTLGAAAAYHQFRDTTLENIAAITGAKSAGESMYVVQEALRGNGTALKTVIQATTETVRYYARSFLSVEGAQVALREGVIATARAFGVSDVAVLRSIDFFSKYVTNQIAAASVSRFAQRASDLLAQGYERLGVSVSNFMVGSQRAASFGSRLAAVLQSLSADAKFLNRDFEAISNAVSSFAGRFNIVGAVSATVGNAFDSVVTSVSGLLSGTTSLSSVMSSTSESASRLSGGLTSALSQALSSVSAAATNAASSVSSFAASAVSRLTPAVSSAVSATTAFASSLYSQFLSSVGAASEAVRRFASSAISMVPSVSAMARTLSSVAGAAARVVGPLGTLLTSINLIRSATDASAAGFAGLLGRMVATTAVTGAILGAISSAAAGTSALGGAALGAGTALSTMSAAFPATTVLAIAAAVATGRFSHELEHLSLQVQSLDQMASRFGSSQEEMAKLRLAADNTNVSMSQLAKGQQAFYTNLSKIKSGQMNVESVREAKLAYDDLGISIEELKNLNPTEAFKEVAKAVSEVKDPADRTRIAFDLFGKQGAAILPALKEVGELEEDFNRLGGAMREIDFKRFLVLENSFDRLKAASRSLRTALVVPFGELQRAFNNISAEMQGGLAAAIGPLSTMLADMTKPLATAVEMLGRMINVALRLIGILTSVAEFFQVFSTIASVFDGIGAGFNAALKPLESLLEMLTASSEQTTLLGTVMKYVQTALNAVGQAIGFVLGAIANLVIAIGVGAAAWGIYTAALALASATSLVAAFNFAAAWAAALGPITLVVGALALLGAAVMAVGVAVKTGMKWLYGLGQYLGLIGKDVDKIDATKASIEELATAAQLAAAIKGTPVPSYEKVRDTVAAARSNIEDLTIQSARFGKAGADAAASAQKKFTTLQQSLGEGTISLEEFNERAVGIQDTLQENLDILASDSPEAALQKNLELYKQLDDSVKAVGKSVRDISAGMQVGENFFPASEEVKARAADYEQAYAAAIEGIKKKQQSGGFAKDLKDMKAKNQADFDSGKISEKQFRATELKLKSTSSQDLASQAAEEAQRALDRSQKKLEIDVSFAKNIREQLETAFLSPVQKFERELKKIQENPELNDEEKSLAEKDLRKRTKESLVGKTAQEQLVERQRDLAQARDSKLISAEQEALESKKALDEFAQAVGVTKTPFEEFSGSLDNIASQFGFVGQPLDEVREKLKETPEKLALFDRALQESRDKLLQSLGIEKSPQAVFEEQMKRIDEAANSKDPNKRISASQADQARAAATRKRDAELGAGKDLAGQFADRRRKIDEAFGGGKDPEKLRIANNQLEMDKREAAGLEATPAQKLQAGVDKINDVFGEAGKGTAEYNEAIKKNAEAVKASLGVEKSGAEKFAESRTKLEQAVRDGVITEQEKNKALKEQRDSLLSSLGISKSPSQEFEDAVDKIKENAAELKPDEIAKGLKEAKDKLLSALGIDKSPSDEFADRMRDLNEAVSKGKISQEEFAKGAQKAKDSLLQSLGIPLDPVKQLGQRMADLDKAMASGQITQEEFARGQEEAKKQFLPGGEEESPVKKFKRDMESLERAADEGLISQEELSSRKANLQAQLQEDLKPALESTKQDRRGIEGADVRSKAGVDTFFRILRGNDNPSLKAQLEIARNTKVLAEAAREPDAAPVIAQLSSR